MEKDDCNRREFITTIAVGSLLLIGVSPIASFGNVKRILDTPNGSDLLVYLDSHGEKRPVTTPEEWAIKRKQILEGMQKAMGSLPGLSGLPPMDIEINERLKQHNYTRYTINFTVAENERVPAYLYVPTRKSKKHRLPAMLALHETDSFGKKSVDGDGHHTNLGYARELAKRGYVVIAPDYPGYGDLKGYDFKTDRYQSGTMKSIFDNIRCIDLLQARYDVDPDRIGVIGHFIGRTQRLVHSGF